MNKYLEKIATKLDDDYKHLAKHFINEHRGNMIRNPDLNKEYARLAVEARTRHAKRDRMKFGHPKTWDESVRVKAIVNRVLRSDYAHIARKLK